jgi:lysophospholipase L1-like esterase
MRKNSQAAQKAVRTGVNLIVFLAAAILALAAAELFFRVYLSIQGDSLSGLGTMEWHMGRFLPPHTYEPDTQYLTEKGHLEFALSEEFERHYNGSNDKFRIIIIGDSFTDGMGLRNKSKRFSAILQERLGDPYDVINLGWGGTNTEDHMRIAQLYFKEHDADLVIIAYFPNDIDPHVSNPLPGREIVSMVNISKRYALAHYIKRMKENRNHMYMNYYIAAYSDKASLLRHAESLGSLIHLIKDNDAEVMLLSLPFLYQLDDFRDYPMKHQVDFIGSVADVNGAIFLDTYPGLSGRRPEELWISSFDNHLNELGHSIVADVILDRIKMMNITEGEK